MVGDRDIAVVFKTRRDKMNLRMFQIGHAWDELRPVADAPLKAGHIKDLALVAATASNIFYTFDKREDSMLKFYLVNLQWDGGELREVQEIELAELATDPSRPREPGVLMNQLFDIAVVRSGNPNLVAAGLENNYLSLFHWRIDDTGHLGYAGRINTKEHDAQLVAREGAWERASISPGTLRHRNDFVVIGKGVANEVQGKGGRWNKTDKGLVLVQARLLDDAGPTIVSRSFYGSGATSAMEMVDVTAPIDGGVVTVSRTNKKYLHTLYWNRYHTYQSQ
jgi:hypothetical protein